jgi:hypothetical protein
MCLVCLACSSSYLQVHSLSLYIYVPTQNKKSCNNIETKFEQSVVPNFAFNPTLKARFLGLLWIPKSWRNFWAAQQNLTPLSKIQNSALKTHNSALKKLLLLGLPLLACCIDLVVENLQVLCVWVCIICMCTKQWVSVLRADLLVLSCSCISDLWEQQQQQLMMSHHCAQPEISWSSMLPLHQHWS